MKRNVLPFPENLGPSAKLYVGEHLDNAMKLYNETAKKDGSELLNPLPCSGKAYSRRVMKFLGSEFEASPLFHEHYGSRTLQELEAFFSNKRFNYHQELGRIRDRVVEQFEHLKATKNLWAVREVIKTKLQNQKAARKAEKKKRAAKRATHESIAREKPSSEEVLQAERNKLKGAKMRELKQRKALQRKTMAIVAVSNAGGVINGGLETTEGIVSVSKEAYNRSGSGHDKASDTDRPNVVRYHTSVSEAPLSGSNPSSRDFRARVVNKKRKSTDQNRKGELELKKRRTKGRTSATHNRQKLANRCTTDDESCSECSVLPDLSPSRAELKAENDDTNPTSESEQERESDTSYTSIVERENSDHHRTFSTSARNEGSFGKGKTANVSNESFCSKVPARIHKRSKASKKDVRSRDSKNLKRSSRQGNCDPKKGIRMADTLSYRNDGLRSKRRAHGKRTRTGYKPKPV